MARRFLGRAIFLRHGQTDYTDVFPDLTEEGAETITKAAESIKSIIDGQQITIISSPMVRAMGSACIVAKILRYYMAFTKKTMNPYRQK